jgi:hypothetical protein
MDLVKRDVKGTALGKCRSCMATATAQRVKGHTPNWVQASLHFVAFSVGNVYEKDTAPQSSAEDRKN